MTDQDQPIAIVRHSVITSVTFSHRPTPEQRAALKQYGAEYRNGQWIRSQVSTGSTDPDNALTA